MKPGDFDFIANLVRDRSGLVLTPDKTYLVESRLGPIARREGIASLEEMISIIKMRNDVRLIEAVVDAMTTNETFFFRDKTPFEHLENIILPDLVAKKRGGTIRIWCAAASTGQEPYTIAMVIDQMGHKMGGCKVEIIGTDISERCLEKAKSGLYTQFEVQRGLPVNYLVKYFKKEGENWRISENIRNCARYRQMNLLDDFRTLGRFDIIFCRNVLIYFDITTKKRVLERMAQQVEGPGYLLMGAAETVLGITDTFRPVPNARGLYATDLAKVGLIKAA
ncbi:MAG: protein-glutamate O-methyltransferase CheR [Caulobacterales bacterium]|nr:protein-glutamate O-methyltransferase CheR [Caulobacterales bacterium]MCA0372335.1 protein-glutamate O-methyltransferase CheR [Pseudomonadota bacterium]